MEVYVAFQQHDRLSRVMGVYFTLADARACLERYAKSAEDQSHAQWETDTAHGMPVILVLTDIVYGDKHYFYVEGPFDLEGTPLQALAEQAE